MINVFRIVAFSFLYALSFSSSASELSLASVFTDHMVIQQHQNISVWGKAEPGSNVEVSFADQKNAVKADDAGEWLVQIKVGSGSFDATQLTVTSKKEQITIDDILIGDVWLVSGQSNMRMSLKETDSASLPEFARERTHVRLLDYTLDKYYPSGRTFSIDSLRTLDSENLFNTEGWQISNSRTNATFSAVGLHFMNRLDSELSVPIGIINVSVGGALTENFISSELLGDIHKRLNLKDYNQEKWIDFIPPWCAERAKENLKGWLQHNSQEPLPHHPYEPGFIYEAGIEPLTTLPIKGVVWYQGESNAPLSGKETDSKGPFDIELSAAKLETLIFSWREAWGERDMPFYIVQLPGLNRPWAPYRNMQQNVANETHEVSYIVTYDLGDSKDVHPKNKSQVGERLADMALNRTYGFEQISIGPVIPPVERVGSVVRVFIDKFELRFGSQPEGFELAEDDGVFHPAKAVVENDWLSVSSSEISEPKLIRYAWFDDPKLKANIVDESAWPLPPFKTKIEPMSLTNN